MPREVRNFPKDKSNKVISARVPIDLFNGIYKFVNNEFGPFETMSDFAIDAFLYSLESWDGWVASPEMKRSLALAKLEKEAKDRAKAVELYMQVGNFISEGNISKARELLPLLLPDHQVIIRSQLGD